ncbi:MAG: rhamnulokinase family protein [Eubacteriales bacterium]
MAKRILAFDFGASSGRAMLASYDGQTIAVEEIHRFSNDPVTLHGHMYWDILRLWHEVKQGMLKARLAGPIDAVGIDTWGVDFALLDRHGELLGNPAHYRDPRTQGIPEEVFERLPAHELYRRTGIQTLRFNTLYQLYYLATRHPERLAQTDKILLIPDLFAYFLTGERRAEMTIASTSNFLDPHRRTWDTDILERLGVPTGILPELIAPGQVYGTLRPELCEELGCPPLPVIAVCTHDTASAVAAVPAVSAGAEGFAYISCGTWSLFGTELPAPLMSAGAEAAQFTNEGGWDGSIRFLKNIMGLWLIQESRRHWMRQGEQVSYAELEAEALAAPPFVSFVDCDAPEFETAGDLPGRVQRFCEVTGQPVPRTRGEIMRCIYQSLAMKYKQHFATLCGLTGVRYPRIHMLGGGIKDTLLCRMTADATGVTVQAGPAEATVMGNIAVCLLSLGELDSLAQARAVIARSVPLATYTPADPDSWDRRYATYQTYVGKSGRT